MLEVGGGGGGRGSLRNLSLRLLNIQAMFLKVQGSLEIPL